MSTKILVELGGPGRTKLAAMREVGAQQVTADLAMDELEATARVLRTVWPQPTGNDNGRGGRLSRRALLSARAITFRYATRKPKLCDLD
jgi:hypothetical protein